MNAIFGGIFIGCGIGLIIRVGGTTAGTTILARMTHKYLGWSISYGLTVLRFNRCVFILFHHWCRKTDADNYYVICRNESNGICNSKA